jgi:hypothetical protein
MVKSKDMRNLIYCIRCTNCKSNRNINIIYVGQTTRTLGERINEHFREISKNEEKRTLFLHFNSEEHSVNDIEVFVLEKLPDNLTKKVIEEHETYWMLKLKTIQNGLNVKVESAEIHKKWIEGTAEEWKKSRAEQYTLRLGLN